jgi:hypothetical protein
MIWTRSRVLFIMELTKPFINKLHVILYIDDTQVADYI